LVLSALSLVGGHFFNRRWDRAVLFFVVLSLLGFGAWALMMTGMLGATDWANADNTSNVMSRYAAAYSIGLAILWIASLGVTYRDASRPNDGLLHRWSKIGVVAAVGLSLLCTWTLTAQALSYSQTVLWTSDQPTGPATESVSRSSLRNSDPYNFQNYLRFGRGPGSSGEPTKPPAGDGYLRGRFVYAGKPVEGITLKLALNDKHETDVITTDVDGVFTVRVPPGEWRVNRVMTQSWKGKPEQGDFIVVTGREPKLGNGKYDSYFWLNEQPLKVIVENIPTPPQMNFEIRDQVKLVWPPLGREGVPGNASNDVISWEAYPGAHDYQIKIINLKRDGDTTYHHEVTTRRLKGVTQFPLSKLESVENKEGEKEYQVSVWAFARDGTYLSSSEEFRNSVFVLKDKEFVREEERALIPGPLDAKKLETLRANNDRIEAIEVLLKDDLVGEAERLLGKIQGATDLGKKKSITGYLLAKQGKCQEANRLFADALSEAGTNCVPVYYRAKCPKNQTKKD
jgi:hypothetical protein